MERLTTNKDVSEMGMYELAHNGCYIRDGVARYRDFETDIDARELTRQLLDDYADGDDAFVDDDDFDEEMLELLMYGTSTIEGLIALFYRNMWAMADLRERLKEYENLEEQGLLIKLPCKVGDTVYAFYYGKNHFSECQIKEIKIRHTHYGNVIYLIEPIGRRGHLYRYYEDDFGKTLFFTRAEAEQRLKEVEG